MKVKLSEKFYANRSYTRQFDEYVSTHFNVTKIDGDKIHLQPLNLTVTRDEVSPVWDDYIKWRADYYASLDRK